MARKRAKANYFTSETEQYINKYNKSTDSDYRAKIFTDHIYLPFYKLAENIIHTFKFYYTEETNLEDLQHEVITFILTKLGMKFDPDNGAKAYSYFGTIVKRWLINYNNKNYKKLKQVGSFDEMEESYEGSMNVTLPGGITLSQFLDMWVEKTYDKMDELFNKDSEKKIADAVLTIFKTRHDLDIFKKKALYIYIREMTDCETPHLTKVISVLKDDFYDIYLKYHDKGKIIIKEL